MSRTPEAIRIAETPSFGWEITYDFDDGSWQKEEIEEWNGSHGWTNDKRIRAKYDDLAYRWHIAGFSQDDVIRLKGGHYSWYLGHGADIEAEREMAAAS